jgi:Protein of unknown function (DUF3108)
MRIAGIIATLTILQAFSHGAAWRATLSEPVRGNFPPLQDLNAKYRFGWSRLLAARATAQFRHQENSRANLTIQCGTVGLARTLWKLDAKHHAIAEEMTLRPLRVDQLEFYRSETIKTHLDFNNQGVVKARQEMPQDKQPKKKRIAIPNLFDLQTALLFVRSQRLRAGDTYRLIVYPGTTSYLATIKVVGRETVKMRKQRQPAIKLELQLNKIAKDFTLQPHTKFRRAYAWLSADDNRLVLRAEAEIFVGRIWMELDEVEYLPDTRDLQASR